MNTCSKWIIPFDCILPYVWAGCRRNACLLTGYLNSHVECWWCWIKLLMFVWHPHCISSWFWAYLFLIIKHGNRTSLAFWMHFTVKVHWVRGFRNVWLPFRVDMVDSYPVYPGLPSLSVPDALAQNFWAAKKKHVAPMAAAAATKRIMSGDLRNCDLPGMVTMLELPSGTLVNSHIANWKVPMFNGKTH